MWLDYGYAVLVLAAALLLGASPLLIIPIGIVVGATFLRGEPARASGDAA